MAYDGEAGDVFYDLLVNEKASSTATEQKKKDYKLAAFTTETVNVWKQFLRDPLPEPHEKPIWPLNEIGPYLELQMTPTLSEKEQTLIAKFAEKQHQYKEVFLGIVSLTISSGHCSEYVIALLGQSIQDGLTISAEIKYEVVVTNPSDAEAYVQIYGVDQVKKNLNVSGKSFVTERFIESHSMNGTEIANKSLRITSEEDILVQVFIRTGSHVEGFLAIPVTHLGNYYQVSTFCALGGYCQIAIAAVSPNTTEIYLQLPLSVPKIVFCVGKKKFFRSKRDRYFNINQFDVVQIETAADLTGTLITASQPIAVFAGTRNLTIGGATAHLVEQLVPADRWRMEYVLGTLGDNIYGDIVKITAAVQMTKIKMTGFPDVMITNTNHTLTRRLDKGTTSHIIADKHIQVIQFSGITYATNGGTPKPSMTTVTPVEDFQKNFTLSCSKENHHDAVYHTVVHKTENDSVTVTDGRPTSYRNLRYTPYNIINFSFGEKDIFTASTTGEIPFGGTLVCDGTAAMPMTFGKQEKTQHIEEPPEASECIEDLTFEFVFDLRRPVQKQMVSTEGFDFIKLRIKTCGHAVIILYKDYNQDTKEVVVLTLMHGKISVAPCMPNCSKVSVYRNDNYNKHNGRNCSVDMSFYWIFQDKQNNRICFGYGPYPDKNCQLILATEFTFQNMRLGGVGGYVFYNYDLHVDGCTRYKADWRCEDKSDYCYLYGEDICNDKKYEPWTMDNCRKFCGKCHTDIYGRQFYALIPRKQIRMSYECEIHVTAQTQTGTINVAVGSTQEIIPGNPTGQTIIYDIDKCNGAVLKAPFVIISDQDVLVTMIVRHEDSGHIGSYQVYPVDAIGKQMMGITGVMSNSDCSFATVSYPARVTVYYEGIKSVRGIPNPGDEFHLQAGKPHRLSSSNSKQFTGVLFQSDRPIYMFCGDQKNVTDFYQIPPTESLGKDYVTPEFESEIVQRPFDATLLIQVDSDNTLVTINGDFDAVIPIYKRGDHVTQPINAGSSYKIKANNNINVALILEDVFDANRKSFLLLPPHTTSTIQPTMYSPLTTSSPLMTEFGPTKIQTYYVHTDRNTSRSNMETVVPGMAIINHSTSQQSDTYYTVSVMYNDANEWMTFASSRHFNSANQSDVCHTTRSNVADGLDNDCDGLVDEDVCFSGYGVYGHDYDLDGGFGEDCGTNDTESTGLTEPIDPLCMPINKPPSECWTVCSCKCSWVEKLEKKESMTAEEIKGQEEADKAKYKEAMRIDNKALSSETSKKESAGDRRQSASTVGYLGITIFALVFGGLILMDLKSLIRDFKTAMGNLKEGLERLWDYINGD